MGLSSVRDRGELLISLCYQPAADRLTVIVLKAKNLPRMDITGLSGMLLLLPMLMLLLHVGPNVNMSWSR
jgi:hypothetical protein